MLINQKNFSTVPHGGFTLLELVLVIIVIGILASAVASIATSSIKASAAVLDVSTTVDKLRYASDRMAFEIRELSSGTIVNPKTGFTSFTDPNTLTFSRVDYSTTTATTRTVTIGQTPVTYDTSGSTPVNKCDGSVTLNYSTPVITPAYVPTLTDKMCSLVFTYYDRTGTEINKLADVRYVAFTLKLQPDAKTGSYEQQTRVALRNH